MRWWAKDSQRERKAAELVLKRPVSWKRRGLWFRSIQELLLENKKNSSDCLLFLGVFIFAECRLKRGFVLR